MSDLATKVAFVAAHPGHELRLATWMTRVKPLFFIIAKGTRAGTSGARIQASRALALELGATPVEPFGAAFDHELYSWILGRDTAKFLDMADALRDAFVEHGVDSVVTDAWQNYNPVHDIAHLLARTAAAEAAMRLGRPVTCFDYPVVPGPLVQAPNGPERMRMVLSKRELAAKTNLVARYPEIAADVEALLAAVGQQVLDEETLHAVLPLADLTPAEGTSPWYESYGEERVAAGVYADVLRWSHMAPIVEVLATRLARAERC